MGNVALQASLSQFRQDNGKNMIAAFTTHPSGTLFISIPPMYTQERARRNTVPRSPSCIPGIRGKTCTALQGGPSRESIKNALACRVVRGEDVMREE